MAQTPPGKDPELLCRGFYTHKVCVWISAARLAPSSISNTHGLLGQVALPLAVPGRWVLPAGTRGFGEEAGCPAWALLANPAPRCRSCLPSPRRAAARLWAAWPSLHQHPPSSEPRCENKQIHPNATAPAPSTSSPPGDGSPALSSCFRARQEGGGGNDSIFRLTLFLVAAPRRCDPVTRGFPVGAAKGPSYRRCRRAPRPGRRRGTRQPRAFTARLPFGSKQITALTSPFFPPPAVVNRFIATSRSFVLFQTPSCFTFKSQTREFSAGRRKSMLKNTSTPQETTSWDIVNKATKTASPGL